MSETKCFFYSLCWRRDSPWTSFFVCHVFFQRFTGLASQRVTVARLYGLDLNLVFQRGFDRKRLGPILLSVHYVLRSGPS